MAQHKNEIYWKIVYLDKQSEANQIFQADSFSEQHLNFGLDQKLKVNCFFDILSKDFALNVKLDVGWKRK